MKGSRLALRDEIERVGFRADPLAGPDADRPHYGLNITIAWPLPAELEAPYDRFAREVAALQSGLYVYPFANTHVTVLTAVSFKSYPDPDPAQAREIDRAAVELGDFLVEDASDVPAFSLDIESPLLASAAAFLPMANPTGEIAGVRKRALAFCRAKGGVLAHASAPQSVHSTVLRFREAPPDAMRFWAEFEAIAATVTLGPITIDHLLVTLETKPYMREGRVTRSVPLRV